MKILCGTCGDASVLPMEIALEQTSQSLRNTIFAAKNSLKFCSRAEDAMNLFAAKDKNRVWLKADVFDRTVQPDNKHKEMWPSYTMDMFFECDLEPKENEIQVLVVVPPPYVEQKYRILVAEKHEYRRHKKPYQAVAETLKNDIQVTAIQFVNSQPFTPCIVLEGSLGMGRTQMVFNLMAYSDVELFYVLCDPTATDGQHESVYSVFQRLTEGFRQCVEQDLKLVEVGVMGEIASHGSLYSYGFISALLTGVKEFLGRQPMEQVEAALL